jgi:outer membrane biosynthesis protein TonB
MAKKAEKNSPVSESKESKVEEVVTETIAETTETVKEEVVKETAKEETATENKPKEEKKPKAKKEKPDPDAKEAEELKTSEEWLAESPYRIMTHDGWNRKTEQTFQFSFYEEKISKKEFDKRLLKSAVKPK